MNKTHAKIQSMSTAEWHQFQQLLENRRLVDYFADEIQRFAHSQLKPEDVLRRFSLNGDGQLDLKEFQLAVKRLGIMEGPGNSTPGSTTDSALKKSRELFSVFCPSSNKKLDIDMFCRIMNEWSLQLIKAQQQQHQQQQQAASSGGLLASRDHVNTIPTPYAVESSHQSSGNSGGMAGDGFVHSEGEMIWRRIRESIVQQLDKLGQIFFKMDITSSGCVTQEEFQLALSHVGIFLTQREFDRLYEALPMELKDFQSATSDQFSIRYADFLAAIQQQNPKSTLVTGAQTNSPPMATNARLWDLLLQALDRLEPLIQQYERAYQRYVGADTFRDILMRCGINLSTPDYAALRVRLLPYSDATGAIGLSALLHALKTHDRQAMESSVRSSMSAPSQGGMPTVSPIRTGRKTVFQSTHQTRSFPPTSSLPTATASLPQPAGKSNEQRNTEANRSIVKIRDESRWKSDINIDASGDTSSASTTSSTSPTDTPLALERRILSKLQQLKDVGQLGSASPQTIFPGDRFNRITRGEFRQSLVHLGLVARYAEVETLFWTLDPTGRGYIVNQDLYDHLNSCATQLPPPIEWTLPSLPPTGDPGSPGGGRRLPRSVQKIFEGMLQEYPRLRSIFERVDVQRSGLITRGELTAAIQEVGVLASPQDVQTAIVAITQRVELDGKSSASFADPYHRNGIVYAKIETRLRQLCSDLLSPKKRRQHLSTASVLLANTSAADSEHATAPTETDALWNCPRRKMNQDHRAMKSSIQITDQLHTGSSSSGRTPVEEDPAMQQPRGRRLAIISILQDLLERRGELKTVMDLHRHADVHGQVHKQDLVDILRASRLSLHFSTAVPAGITATEFVDVLYPQSELTVTFLDVLHRVSDLLADLTRATPISARTASGIYSNNAYPRETVRRMHRSPAPGTTSPSVSYSPIQVGDHTVVETGRATRRAPPVASDELSLQRKLLYDSRLSELLASDKGRQSAAVLVRHAFKGVMARELVVPVDNGEYEAVCRASDLKHVCFRLGLDLDVGELQFLIASIDVNGSGYVSSPQLMQFFTHLAMRGQTPRLLSDSEGSSSSSYLAADTGGVYARAD